ncbi:MAG: DNA-protecting protein DprA [Bacteroidetes bacterium]|nr:DNA-protecting protein DprA [Bacteroidota bacterium]
MSESLLYQIALTQIPGIGPVQAKQLLKQLGSPENIFKEKISALSRLENIGAVRARNIKSFTHFKAFEKEIKFIEKNNITPLFIQDEHYPKRLLNCYDPPIMLYFRGNADLNASKIISIIGTRIHSDYGKMFTEKLISDLSSLNVLIVSGLAYGIDTIAHKASLKNALNTIAVLAHGLQSIYPASHTDIAKEMCDRGGLLTEYMSSEKPDKHNFPKRNRIVAGIADATIVIETAIKGGSMITAELANNYNRDVFAVPGKTIDPKSAGCNYLIKNNKAALLTSARDLIEYMSWENAAPKKKIQKELFIEFSDEEKKILQLFSVKEVMHIDDIYLQSGLNSSTVAAAILNLEFQNVLSSLPGKLYKMS